MSRISPTLEGFRAAFHRPSLTFAEISWRWTIGATATALYSFLFFEYLDTLPVTSGDLLLLSTRQPILIGQAFGHIFRGSLPRVVMAGLVAAMMLTFLWIFAASVGRAATVRSLIDYFAERSKAMANGQESDPLTGSTSLTNQAGGSRSSSRPMGPLLRLNFLRAGVALAAILGLVGAAILVDLISTGLASTGDSSASVTPSGSPPPDSGSGLAVLLFFPLAGLIFVAWSGLNWVLSVAGVFAVRDGDASRDALGALSAAVAFCRERTGAIFAVSTWTGLGHLSAFVVATTAVSMPLALAQIAPGRVVLAGVILITLAYFAVADWLYTVRLAGYVCIAVTPQALLAPAPLAPLPVPPPIAAPPVQTTIDRDEPILSDVPNLAVET
jgi:hypothetical protein